MKRTIVVIMIVASVLLAGCTPQGGGGNNALDTPKVGLPNFGNGTNYQPNFKDGTDFGLGNLAVPLGSGMDLNLVSGNNICLTDCTFNGGHTSMESFGTGANGSGMGTTIAISGTKIGGVCWDGQRFGECK